METPSKARKATRREQEYRLRRQEIMKAAKTLFVEKGLRNTTLDEIAERSAFGKGTIYNYFTSKDELFLAIIHQLIDETLAETRVAMDNAAENPRAKLLAYALATISHFHANNEVFLMLTREHNQLDPKVIATFVDRFVEKLNLIIEPLEAGIRAGRIRAEDPRKLAVFYDGMIRTYCMANTQELWPSGAQTPADVAGLIASIFCDGIENKQTQG
jgi:AcrR family transcriptional regulator